MEQNPSPGEFINPSLLVVQFGLRENMHVADFGIGSGHFTILMAKNVGEGGIVTALDILEAPLEVVRNNSELEGLENIKFVRADLEVKRGSTLDDSSQDLVLLANILFQSEQRKDILEEAVRVTKAGGRIIVIDWKKDLDALGGPPKEFRVDPEEIKKLTQEIGLNFITDFEAGKYHYGITFSK